MQEIILNLINGFMKNYLIVISLLILTPVAKLAINSYVQIKTARISTKNSYVVSWSTSDGEQRSLEIHSNDLSLKELNSFTRSVTGHLAHMPPAIVDKEKRT